MRHYFVNREKEESEFFSFKEAVLGDEYLINSCNDIFSKSKIDYGTVLLLETFIEQFKNLNSANATNVSCETFSRGQSSKGLKESSNKDVAGSCVNNTKEKTNQLNILDMGCGYGIISMVLNKHLGCKITAADINTTALELTNKNLLSNGFNLERFALLESNLYSNINNKYNHIVTNPPIKVGKEILFGLVSGAPDALVEGGTITLVIRKDAGMESLKKHMQNTFGNCQILKRHKGYFILQSVK